MVKEWVKCFICKKKFWPANSNEILCDVCRDDQPDVSDDDEPVVE